MSNIIDSIQLSGTTYQIQGSGGNNVVELTQAQYDALVTGGTVDPNTFYIITDATAGDLTNYYTKPETNTLLGGKQATLVSGTNIKTINNESILGSGNIDIQGGGGKAIEAGRGISITTGETADTVSFNLPISAGTGTNSIIGGDPHNSATNEGSVALGGWYNHQFSYNLCKATGKGAVSLGGQASGEDSFTAAGNSKAKGTRAAVIASYSSEATGMESFATGRETTANTFASFTQGKYTKTTNEAEVALGENNKSVSASTTFGDSGNTLFSVGNGTADNARHNAFEIRQNGDIYLSLNGQDVKLQDILLQLSGTTS